MKKINFFTVAAISAATVFSGCDEILDQFVTKEIPVNKSFVLEALVALPETDGEETVSSAANTQFFPFTGQEVINIDSLELGDDVQYLPNLQEVLVDDIVLSVSAENQNGSIIDVEISSPEAGSVFFDQIFFNDSIKNDKPLTEFVKTSLEHLLLNEQTVVLDWQGKTDALLDSKISITLTINGRLKVKLLQKTEETSDN